MARVMAANGTLAKDTRLLTSIIPAMKDTVPLSLILFLATFNVRGLCKVEKQYELDEDCIN